MDELTDKAQLANDRLGGRLAEFLDERRVPGNGFRSWRRIARELDETTGVDVTPETLRDWHAAMTKVAE